jgi:hypothetical protein
MKRPEEVTLSREEGEALIERIERNALSAVQYVRFPLSPEARAAFRDERQDATVIIDHPNYQARARLSPEVRRTLAAEV